MLKSRHLRHRLDYWVRADRDMTSRSSYGMHDSKPQATF